MCGGWVGKNVVKPVEKAVSSVGKGVEAIGQGVAKGDLASIAAVALVVVSVANPALMGALATQIGTAVGLSGTAATVAGGAIMGGTVGAAMGTKTGGDAIWKSGVAGAVAGGTAAGLPGGGGAAGAVGRGAAAGAIGGATSAGLSGKSVGETALKGGIGGGVVSGLTYGAGQIGEAIAPTKYADYYNPEEGAFKYDSKTGEWTQVAKYNPETQQYMTDQGQVYTPQEYTTSYGKSIGEELGKTAGRVVNQELFTQSPTQTYSTGGEVGAGRPGGGQTIEPQISTGSTALAQALRTTPGVVGGGSVEPSSGEGAQENVWNVSSLKLKDALGA